MNIEVILPLVQVPLDKVRDYLPNIKRLEQIAKEPPIKEGATRRVIDVVRNSKEELEGYRITDWNRDRYLGYKNFDK